MSGILSKPGIPETVMLSESVMMPPITLDSPSLSRMSCSILTIGQDRVIVATETHKTGDRFDGHFDIHSKCRGFIITRGVRSRFTPTSIW